MNHKLNVFSMVTAFLAVCSPSTFSQTLIDNTLQPTGGGVTITDNQNIFTGFTVGSSDVSLGQLDFVFTVFGASDTRLELWGDLAGNPNSGDVVCTMSDDYSTAEFLGTNINVTFTPAGTCDLSAGTSYWAAVFPVPTGRQSRHFAQEDGGNGPYVGTLATFVDGRMGPSSGPWETTGRSWTVSFTGTDLGPPATAPEAPTIGIATAGDRQASVAFTAPENDGGSAITGYTVTSSSGGFTSDCAGSPCTVTGLTNGTTYTFTVVAINNQGSSPESSASNEVIPDSDEDGDGIGDSIDAFPDDPVENVDSDDDGIGDNGDAGGTGVGIRILNAPVGCTFMGPVRATETQFADSAPGVALGTQLGFELSSCGDSVTLEALFGEDLPAGSRAYKVSATGDWIEIPGAVIDGGRITYTVVDNGPLDDDDILGQITDPVTAVTPISAERVPTLPLGMLLFMTGVLGVLGLRRLSA